MDLNATVPEGQRPRFTRDQAAQVLDGVCPKFEARIDCRRSVVQPPLPRRDAALPPCRRRIPAPTSTRRR